MRLAYYFLCPAAEFEFSLSCVAHLYVQLNIVQVYSSATQPCIMLVQQPGSWNASSRIILPFYPAMRSTGKRTQLVCQYAKPIQESVWGKWGWSTVRFRTPVVRRRALIVRWRTKINLRCNAEKVKHGHFRLADKYCRFHKMNRHFLESSNAKTNWNNVWHINYIPAQNLVCQIKNENRFHFNWQTKKYNQKKKRKGN